MILGFKTAIDGKPTYFREKILKHLGAEATACFLATKRRFTLEYLNSIREATPKRLTIREDQHQRWKPGRKIQFATGVRTKAYECFAEGECTQVVDIFFHFYEDFSFSTELDGRSLSEAEFNQLAQDDGFDSPQDFINFHMPRKHPEVPFYPLNGWMRKRVIYF